MCTQEIIQFLTQHTILSIVWISLLIIIIYTSTHDWIYKIYQISHNQAIFLINKKKATIIDMRNSDDYASGHIINSINISIEKIKKNDCLELKKLKKYPLIIVHDNNTLSHSSIKHFKNIGFKNVYILQGGITNWKINNLPLLLKKIK